MKLMSDTSVYSAGVVQGPDVGYVIAGVRTGSEKDSRDASLWFTRVLSD
jgi:hypothetical protein